MDKTKNHPCQSKQTSILTCQGGNYTVVKFMEGRFSLDNPSCYRDLAGESALAACGSQWREIVAVCFFTESEPRVPGTGRAKQWPHQGQGH